MAQDSTNPRIKLVGGVSSGDKANVLSGFNESAGNVLNVQPLKIQPKPFSDPDMERVAGQMEDAVKQEQIDAIIKSKIQDSFTPNLLGIKPKVVMDALVGGIKESVKTFGESTEAIGEGDVSGGLAGYLHGTMQGVFSLAQVTPQLGAFTTALNEIQETGLVSDKVINTVMAPVTTLMQEVEKNPDLLKKIIHYAPTELKSLLASDVGRKSLAGITDVGVQAGLFHAITKGIKKVGNSSIDVQGETFFENPTKPKLLTENAGRNPIKQKNKETYQKETSSAQGDRPFIGSQVGDTKIKLTPEEQKMMSQQKLKFEQLDTESKNLINKQMVLTEALKKNKTKANKDALRETNRKLEDVTAERNAIEDAINELGSYYEQRQLKGLLPERGSSTTYGFDISGTNKPSTGVNFVLPKEKVLEVGREGIIDKPLEGVPVKKSVHDFLTERGLDLFKLVKADKPIDSGLLGDILGKAKDSGVYDQVLSILRQEAFKRGKVQEFETALGKANERVKVNITEEPKGLLNEGQKENPQVQVKDIKSFEEFRNASTPEITNFVKKELGDTEFNKLVKEASDRPENLTPVEGKTVTDMQSRAIEDAIYAKAQDIIFDKNQPKADPNRIISDEAYKNAGDYLRSKLNDVSSNPLFDAKAYQALLIRGAYHLENGVVRFSEWSKRMIEEHGEKIKSSLIFLWNDLQKNAELTKAGLGATLRDKTKVKDAVRDNFAVNTENMTTPKQKIVNQKLDNLTKDIQDFMNNKNVDKQTQNNVVQLIKDMEREGGRKFTSTQMTDFRRHFLDKLTNLTQYYGKFGGELGNKSFRASSDYAKLMSDGHTILNKVTEIKDKVSPKDFKKSYGRVVDALQDRSNANNILQNDPIAQQMYPIMQDFFNYFRKVGEDKGYKMVDDYYMRMAEQSLYDDFVKTKDIQSLSTDGLINFRSANSKFLKERVRDEAHNIRTDFNGVYNYLYSISRELAYKELRDWAGKDFVEGVKSNKKLNQDLGYAQKTIDALINPDRMQGKWWKRVESAKHNMYTAYLWNNPKLAIVNYYQKQVAKTLISKDAEVLANKIYNEKYQPTGRLYDAITEAKADAPAYLGEGAIEYTINKGKLRELAEKYDMFRMSEGSNWKYSEGAGIVDYVMKTTGAKTFEQINKFLEDQSVFDRAVDYARDLSARTQVSPDVAFRPLAYDHPMSRLLLMFTRYPLAMTDLMYKTLARSLEGVDGIRAQNILRRGLSEDTKPVEMLQSVEYMRKNLELSLKEVKKNRYDSPVDNKVIKSYIDFFKAKEKELNGIIKDIEPLEKTRMAGKWAKYIGISASVSFAYRLFESELWDAIGLDKDKRKKSVGQHFRDALVDATPLPLFRATSGDLTKPPIMPTIDIFLYGNFNPKGATRQTIDYISTATPYINVMSQAYRRLTGNTIGNLTSKTIYGTEKRGQQR